ncbi:hypothetical protein [Jeotgalibacillus soli]|uniref:Uncharacterized protein n=1 Tax=Jeotgalibacillus soli TaxID=889306 RepID=A0A0C2R1M4_9BACL|nr:hypothetical protein [Jeotgalibacillus soli]KIL44210.1 hypothetical protein KP78_31740 [Jeotgalibacillus soli]
MKKIMLLFILLCSAAVLAGCMYPAQQRAENEIPYEDQIAAVQGAVDQYQEDSGGLLPIKTVEEDTPIYQKYMIDFSMLKPRYLAELPGNAYENGGVFQYVLTDVEEDPTVRIFDLRIPEEIRTLNIRIQANRGIPFKAAIGDNVYSIDYEQLGYKEDPMAMSPYTNRELPFVTNGDGTIFVDYITDLYHATQDIDATFEEGQDIRSVLLEESMFVPAYSMPYFVDENGDIVYGDSRDPS